MPRRSAPGSVLVIGPGPVTTGQAAELDSAGTQACRVLREEGLRVTVVDSNPATITTDPEQADATYLEPVTAETAEKVIAKERPDALLPTVGGRTALAIALALNESGVLARYGVELIGADIDTIRAGRDRGAFRRIARRAGAEVARGVICRSPAQCQTAADDLGYPVAVWPVHHAGGTGPRVAHDRRELSALADTALTAGPAGEVLLEESLLGWKTFELELLRDRDGDVAVVGSTEYLEPMGSHAGDSIAVTPAMTLSERDHRRMRDAAAAVTAGLGVTGGVTVRFAVDPRTGRMTAVATKPGTTRSSALAATATGLPLARIATRLALGHTLRELHLPGHRLNGLRGQTIAQPPPIGEPSPDHVVVRVSRFASGGESVAIGRSFPEALHKALRPLAADGRINQVHQAIRAGATVDELTAATGIDPWFLEQIARVEQVARLVAEERGAALPQTLRLAKRHGLSDARIARLRGMSEEAVRELRRVLGIRPGYPATSAGCRYSSYAAEPGALSQPSTDTPPKIIILGGGPTRTGHGIDSDYLCAHAGSALAAAGYDPVLVHCAPASGADGGPRLYCEPLTFEDVLEVVAAEQATGEVAGVLLHLGGETPLGLADRLAEAGVPIMGTPAASPPLPDPPRRLPDDATVIDVDALYDGKELYVGGITEHVEGEHGHSGDPACTLPPVTLGRADLARIRESTEALAARIGAHGLIAVRFALAAGLLHVRGARPGAGRTVPFVSKAIGVPLAGAAARIMLGAGIAELRADGTLPAAGDGGTPPPGTAIAVRATALPRPGFRTGEGGCPATSPASETAVTGEVMGIAAGFGAAYAKARAAAHPRLPAKGRALVSIADRDKRVMVLPLKVLADTGFEILATEGTADVLRRNGVPARTVRRPGAGPGPDGEPTAVDRILAGEPDLVVTTPCTAPARPGAPDDGRALRTAAAIRGIPCVTTVLGLAAAVQGIEAESRGAPGVSSLQEYAKRRAR
ncbi:carbamoyl phosphate synthase large subunit [Kitasatospora sp. NPDC091335]|uniref:carbamoyl phosphate synthase preATP-grasp domain-containing protein n=1 Tax=Kitasatospora sp. NPDC091335 TaxID=3364085 RepID=UPI00383091B8